MYVTCAKSVSLSAVRYDYQIWTICVKLTYKGYRRREREFRIEKDNIII